MTRDSKPFVRVTCDGCGTVLSDGEHDWWDDNSVVELLHESKWRSIELDKGTGWGQHRWVDACPDCWRYGDPDVGEDEESIFFAPSRQENPS